MPLGLFGTEVHAEVRPPWVALSKGLRLPLLRKHGRLRHNIVYIVSTRLTAGRDRTDTPTLLSLERSSDYEPPRRDAARSALPAFCSTAAKTAAKSASNMSVTLLPSLAEVSK